MESENMAGKLAEIKKDALSITDKVNSLKIKNPEDMKSATDLLSMIVGRKKRIEELRVRYVKPLNEQVKMINNDFKGAILPLTELEGVVKGTMLDYRKKEAEKIEKQRLKAEEKERKKFEAQREKERIALEKEKEDMSKKEIKQAEAEIEKEEFEFDDDDFKQQKSVHSDNGSVKIRKQWTFKVVEPSKVPKKYLIVDEKAIRKAVKDGERSINGVEIFEEEIVGVSV